MEFKNKSFGTRNGFAHTSELFVDNELKASVKCNYLNRTWEAYTFQSAMKQAVSVAIENEILAQKHLKQIKRLTKALREDIINSSPLIQRLQEKYKSL